LCAHYHFTPQTYRVRAANQKGRVERAIRYVRDSFWAGRSFLTLAECNRQALLWRDQVAHQRPWPGDDRRTVAQAFAEERPRLLPLPAHPFATDLARGHAGGRVAGPHIADQLDGKAIRAGAGGMGGQGTGSSQIPWSGRIESQAIMREDL